jgi:hypothetical protein
MASAKDVYVNAIEGRLDLGEGWHAVWLPGARIEVGMVGRLVDDVFNVYGRLSDSDRGIHFDVDSQPQHSHLSYATQGGVDIVAKAQGSTNAAFKHIAAADAGVKFAFKQEKAVAVAFHELVEKHVASYRQLERDVVAAADDREKRMEYGDIVITHVIHAASGVALMAERSGSEVELKADVNLGDGPIDVGKVGGKLSIVTEEAMVFAATMPDGVTVAYRAGVVTTSGFGSQTVFRPTMSLDVSLQQSALRPSSVSSES